MVHPETGAIYVITKERSGQSGVYTFPDPLPVPSVTRITTLTEVATLQVPTYTVSEEAAAPFTLQRIDRR